MATARRLRPRRCTVRPLKTASSRHSAILGTLIIGGARCSASTRCKTVTACVLRLVGTAALRPHLAAGRGHHLCLLISTSCSMTKTMEPTSTGPCRLTTTLRASTLSSMRTPHTPCCSSTTIETHPALETRKMSRLLSSRGFSSALIATLSACAQVHGPGTERATDGGDVDGGRTDGVETDAGESRRAALDCTALPGWGPQLWAPDFFEFGVHCEGRDADQCVWIPSASSCFTDVDPDGFPADAYRWPPAMCTVPCNESSDCPVRHSCRAVSVTTVTAHCSSETPLFVNVCLHERYTIPEPLDP